MIIQRADHISLNAASTPLRQAAPQSNAVQNAIGQEAVSPPDPSSSFQKTREVKEHHTDPVALPARFPPTASTVQVADATRFGDQLQQAASDALAYV